MMKLGGGYLTEPRYPPQIIQSTVGAELLLLLSVQLGENPGLFQRVEGLSPQQRISRFPIGRFNTTVLLATARLVNQRLSKMLFT